MVTEKLKRMLIVLLVAVMVLSNVTGILGITKTKEAEAEGSCTRDYWHCTCICNGGGHVNNGTCSFTLNVTQHTSKTNTIYAQRTSVTEYNITTYTVTWWIAPKYNSKVKSDSSTLSTINVPNITQDFTCGGSIGTGNNRNLTVEHVTVSTDVMKSLYSTLWGADGKKSITLAGEYPTSGKCGRNYHMHKTDGSDATQMRWYWNNDNITTWGIVGSTTTVSQYTLTYDGNKPNENAADETNVPETVGVNKNTATAISATIPVCEGYVFTGWNTNANGTGTAYSPGASISMTEDVTLYAQWTPGICSPTYVENLSDTLGLAGMPSPNPQTATTETNVTVSTNVPTSTNYWFLGWNTVANPTTENPGTVYAAGTIWRNDSLAFSEFCLCCRPFF